MSRGVSIGAIMMVDFYKNYKTVFKHDTEPTVEIYNEHITFAEAAQAAFQKRHKLGKEYKIVSIVELEKVNGN